MADYKKYWDINCAISILLVHHGLVCNEDFIDACVERVMSDAGDEWNDDDCKIAIRNELNELIQKNF